MLTSVSRAQRSHCHRVVAVAATGSATATGTGTGAGAGAVEGGEEAAESIFGGVVV